MTFEEWCERYNGGILLDDTLTASAMRSAAQDAWEAAQPQWQPPETAPKDGSTFLADVGYPWPVLAVWSKAHNEWACADYQLDVLNGEWVDAYFQTEYEKPDGLRAWMPLPKINK